MSAIELAETCEKRGDLDQALRLYGDEIGHDSKNVKARIGHATVLAAKGYASMALCELDAIIREFPGEARAYADRARIRAEPVDNGDKVVLGRASADVKRALELDPTNSQARLARGIIAVKQWNRDAAIVDLSWVIEGQPDHAEALIFRGLAFSGKGETDRALADFNRAAVNRPGGFGPLLLGNRGQCYADKGDLRRGIADLAEAIRACPQAIRFRKLRSDYYLKLGDLEQALVDYDQLIRLRPDDPSIHFSRMTLLSEMGDSVAVAEEADRLVKLLPNQPGPYFLRGVSAWLVIREQDSDMAELDYLAEQIERFLPSAPAPHIVRIFAAGMTGVGRMRPLADIDRCVALEPRLSSPHAVRVIFNAHEGRFGPTCRDLALFVLKFDRRNYRPFASIDWKNQRFAIGFCETGPRSGAAAKPQEPASEIGKKCIDLGFQQLLAGTLGSSNR